MQFNAAPSTGSGSKNFVRLGDGESIVGVFAGNPYEHYVVWKDQKTLPAKQGDPGASFRFKMNFVTKENGALVVKIFEGGARVYNMLKELHEEHGLDQTVVVIKRNGVDKNTTYSVMPGGKNNKWTPELGKQIETMALHDLGGKSQPDSADPDEEIPF